MFIGQLVSATYFTPLILDRKMSVTKGLSSLRKKVSKYKQTKDYSDSNSSIVSYASDGEGVPDGDDEQSKLFVVVSSANQMQVFRSCC